MKSLHRHIVQVLLVLIALLTSQAFADVSEEDRLAIRETLSSYAYFWDFKYPEQLTELFTEDCVYQAFTNEKLIAELKSNYERNTYFVKRFSELHSSALSTQHQFGRINLEAGPDGEIIGESQFVIYWVEGQGEPFPKSIGTYKNIFVKTETGWKIHRHEIHLSGLTL